MEQVCLERSLGFPTTGNNSFEMNRFQMDSDELEPKHLPILSQSELRSDIIMGRNDFELYCSKYLNLSWR